ncbi:MAG TPA: hypothetical protein PLX89_02280, partial [Verrucomicrobiota bacterium]|nr:hypothetical protein [Verrucomicrobiota bacterium]
MAGKIALFLAGLVVGAGLTLWGIRIGAPPSASSLTESAAAQEAAAIGQEFDRVSARIAELEVEKLDLASELRTLKAQLAGKGPSPAVHEPELVRSHSKPEGKGATNRVRAAMQDMMRAALQQQVEGKLAQMQTRLQLSPEQAEQARAILERQFSTGIAMAEKVMAGDANSADLSDLPDTL